MKTKLLFTAIILIAGSSQFIFGQWSAPVNLSPAAVQAGLNESMGSCIGVSNDTIHVVWTDKLSTTSAALYYSRSVDTGLTWSTPIAITALSGNAWNPAIAVNGPNVHVVWRYINPANNRRASYYKHSTDGGNTWGADMFIDSTADWPAVTVSGSNVYIANDSITSAVPYNTEIFLLRSTDNGNTWLPHQQISFSVGRSEDEAIHAEGQYVHMSWNDKRTGKFQIFYKESTDYGVTWGPDVVVDTASDYNTMVWSDGANVDVIAAGAPSGRYQVLWAHSGNTGTTWPVTGTDISNDTAHTYFLPDMVRNGSDLHVVSSSAAGAKYFHSADGGTTWDIPYSFTGSSTFVAYTGCAVHIIYVNTGKIYYIRNPTANAGHCGLVTEIAENIEDGFTIAPNPFSEQTVINFSKEQKHTTIKIIDLLGREVKSIVVSGKQLMIEKGEMNSGIYFVQVTDDKMNVVNGKIVIE